MRSKDENTQNINPELLAEILRKIPMTNPQISRACGFSDGYIKQAMRNGRIGGRFAEKMIYIFGVDISPACVKEKPVKKEQPQTPVTPVTNVTPVTPVNTCDTEKLIAAIGQATGIVNDQLAEIIKLLKALNESREAEITAMRRSITDSMVSAIILGLQESKGTIGDGVKLGISNSGELRNAIAQGIRGANR